MDEGDDQEIIDILMIDLPKARSRVQTQEEDEKESASSCDLTKEIITRKQLRVLLSGTQKMTIKDAEGGLPAEGTKAYTFNQAVLEDLKKHIYGVTKLRYRLFKGPYVDSAFKEGPIMIWQILKPYLYAGGVAGVLVHYTAPLKA